MFLSFEYLEWRDYLIESCFDFLYDFDKELLSDCLEVEKCFINRQYECAIENCSSISYSIAKKVSKYEGFNNYLNLNQSELLKELGSMGIIRFEYQRPFDEIKRINASLDDFDVDELFSFSKKAHKLLFNIVLWYFKKYNDELLIESNNIKIWMKISGP